MHTFNTGKVLAVFSERSESDLSFNHFSLSQPPINWLNLASKLNLLDSLPFYCSQVHQDTIIDLSNHPCPGNQGAADALATVDNLGPIGVFTADCLPILITGTRAIACIHASWKNSCLGISKKMVSHLIDGFGESANSLEIFMGPCIGQCCLELGDEIISPLIVGNPYIAACASKGNKWHLDLRALNVLQCLGSGVSIENIHHVNDCTKCMVDKYFSYRGNGGHQGSMFSFIYRNAVFPQK